MGSSSSTVSLTVSDPQEREYGVVFDSEPFMEGTHRKCYTGTLIKAGAPKNRRKIVLKVFKSRYIDQFGAHYECILDLERSMLCHQYAMQFNSSMKQHTTPRISFVPPYRLNVKHSKCSRCCKPISNASRTIPIRWEQHSYLTVQPWLQSDEGQKYTRMSSNNGWMVESRDHHVLAAFSHFSWAQSKGKLLICGFQGIQQGNTIFLSDAVVHSEQAGKLGITDLGLVGMAAFFKTHQCNDCCKHLPSPDVSALIERRSLIECRRSNTYLFELDAVELKKEQQMIEATFVNMKEPEVEDDEKEVSVCSINNGGEDDVESASSHIDDNEAGAQKNQWEIVALS